MRITPKDCDKARLLNKGIIRLGAGSYDIDPEADLTNIHFVGVGKGTVITVSPSGTRYDNKMIQGVLDALPGVKMSRGSYKGKENFPHKFELCLTCGKKGVYERSSLLFAGGREKVCRYCKRIQQIS